MTLSLFSALKNKNYRIYFAGQMFSMSGTWMQSVVQGWLVYRLSNSGYWLGLITFLTQFPAFMVTPIAGVVADLRNRRKLLMFVAFLSMLQAFVLAYLVFSHQVQLWHIAVLSIFLGFLNAFDIVTRHTFIVDMVGKKDLGSAIGLNAFIINSSRIIGPAAAGILIGIVSDGVCFLLNGISYLAVIYSLWRLKKAIIHNPKTSSQSFLEEYKKALVYVSEHSLIFQILCLSSFMSFTCFCYLALLPVFAKEILAGNAHTLAILTCSNGFGALAGSLGIKTSMKPENLIPELNTNLILVGISLVLLGYSDHVTVSALAIACIGYCLMRAFPMMNYIIQQVVSDELRGRIISLYTMTFLAFTPLGSLLSGYLSDHFGAEKVVTGAGTVCICFAFIFLIAKKFLLKA